MEESTTWGRAEAAKAAAVFPCFHSCLVLVTHLRQAQAQAHSTAHPPQSALCPAYCLRKTFSFHPLCRHWSVYILCSCPMMFCSQLLPVGKGALPTHMWCKLRCFNPFGPCIHCNVNTAPFRSKDLQQQCGIYGKQSHRDHKDCQEHPGYPQRLKFILI